MPLTSLSLAVVGAAFDNKDGSNRRFEIKLCSPGEPVLLQPEPKNPVDPQAVSVLSARGVQIGYVRAERAPLLRGWIMSGRELEAIFQEETDWGAVIRVAIDGARAELPSQTHDVAAPRPATRSPEGADDDPGFWPDELPPDD